MNYETILVNRENNGVCVLTLNRPERLNALSRQMFRELNDFLCQMESDDSVHVLVITGAPRPDGRGCFCAGADLKEMAGEENPPDYLLRVIQSFWTGEPLIRDTFDKLTKWKKVTIAAIDGVCTAGGLELALSCDMRIVAETAQISDMHIKNLGIIGGGEVNVRLARLVGESKAKEIVMTGEVMDGKEAWRIGFANRVVPTPRLMDAARGLAATIAGMNFNAVIAAKATIDIARDLTDLQALRYNDIYWTALGSASDLARNFTEKRKEK